MYFSKIEIISLYNLLSISFNKSLIVLIKKGDF
jgi:hypothetical protein